MISRGNHDVSWNTGIATGRVSTGFSTAGLGDGDGSEQTLFDSRTTRATARVDVVNTTLGGGGLFRGGMAILIRRMNQSRKYTIIIIGIVYGRASL